MVSARALLGVFFRLVTASAILMHGILRLLSGTILNLLGLAGLLDFSSGSGSGAGRGSGKTTAGQAGGAGERQ
jgi:hypothetical protein